MMSSFVIVGNPESRRVELFQAALWALALPPARVISYLDVMSRDDALSFTPDEIVRIESPGKDFEVERALLSIGSQIEDPDGDYERLSEACLQSLTFDKGRILPSRQWYLGYCAVLRRIERALNGRRVMNTPADIRLMFDKRACHAYLKDQGLPEAESLGPIGSYDELVAQMQEKHCAAVFVKLAHSSSASGVVAYRFNGNRHQATTTVEMARSGQGLLLYNSRRIRQYEDRATIATLVNALCRNRVHVERWIPKAAHRGKAFDLRLVMIAGQVQHIVLRMSHSPLTNLHLLNERGNYDEVLAKIGTPYWAEVQATCEAAARTFSSLYCGLDVLLRPDYRHHAILEVNAFGDLLPGLLHKGQDTYTAEITATIEAEGQ